MQRFAGRKAIVTGASRGIGAAVAERLAAEGADVVITARTVSSDDHHLAGSLHDTVERCRRYGTTVEWVAADLADADSRATIIPAALEILDGRVDVLVNNAAAAIYDSVLDYPLRRRRLMFEVNLQAPIDLSQTVVPLMRRPRRGLDRQPVERHRAPRPGPPFRTEGVAASIGVYGATKAALNRITNAFAVELQGTGIRVNTVEPRAAVMSEGAEALVGDIVTDDLIESMEAMVEAVVALCDCPPERTGHVHVSLDLVADLGLQVMTLDGSRGLRLQHLKVALGAHPRALLDEAVPERAEPLDAHLEHVAGHQELRWVHADAHTRGRPGQHEIARLHGHDRGEVGDELRDAEDQVARPARLPHLAVEDPLDLEVGIDTADLLGRDGDGAHRGAAVPRLARRPLHGVVLVVAHGEVVRGT